MKVLVYQIGQPGDTIVSIPALRAVRHDEFIPRYRADAVAAQMVELYAEIGGRS